MNEEIAWGARATERAVFIYTHRQVSISCQVPTGHPSASYGVRRHLRTTPHTYSSSPAFRYLRHLRPLCLHGGSGRKAHADQPKAPNTVASTTAQMVERFYALLKLRNGAVAPESRVHPHPITTKSVH